MRHSSQIETHILIRAGDVFLEGEFIVPDGAQGIVLFARQRQQPP